MAKPYFDDHVFSLTDAELELAEFRTLLDTNTDLAERDQVLANFKTWPNLCAMLGQYNIRLGIGDLIRREFRILPPLPDRPHRSPRRHRQYLPDRV